GGGGRGRGTGGGRAGRARARSAGRSRRRASWSRPTKASGNRQVFPGGRGGPGIRAGRRLGPGPLVRAGAGAEAPAVGLEPTTVRLHVCAGHHGSVVLTRIGWSGGVSASGCPRAAGTSVP